MDKMFLSWFAGYLDADGCFSIVLGKQRSKKLYLAIRPQVRIGQRHTKETEEIMQLIKNKTNLGKIYYSNKDKENSTIYWQTTSHSDSLKVAKLVYPYLKLKRERAGLFIKALDVWRNKQPISKGIFIGQKERSVDTVLELVKIATSINASRQTKRYRDYKGYNYWEPLIRKWYK